MRSNQHPHSQVREMACDRLLLVLVATVSCEATEAGIRAVLREMGFHPAFLSRIDLVVPLARRPADLLRRILEEHVAPPLQQRLRTAGGELELQPAAAERLAGIAAVAPDGGWRLQQAMTQLFAHALLAPNRRVSIDETLLERLGLGGG
jgi:hypothetical protein